jgi:SAM-dependent methyltransferase
MTQRSAGLYSVLGAPYLYTALQRVIRTPALQTVLLDELGLQQGDRLLDIGCGTGRLSAALPDVDYVGFDLSERYIEHARRKFGDFGTFFVGDVTDWQERDLGTFDAVLAFGVLHHVDDYGAATICELAASVLGDSGHFVTVDGCFDASESRASRFMVGLDRGQSIRTTNRYGELLSKSFARVDTTVRRDLYRIPYTLLIANAFEPAR